MAPPFVLDPLPRAVLCYLTERARCFFTRRHIALHVTATKQELDYALVGLLSRGYIVRMLGLYGVLRTADEVPTFDAVEESLEQRLCPRCLGMKPSNQFYAATNRNCKTCVKQASLARYYASKRSRL